MKKFISTLLCIVFVAALMPAQIAKADSDVMSVANQVKVPILNEQTYNNKKLMNKYTRDMSDWWATDLTLTAGMLFKRCDVDNAYYQYWGSINEAVETMGMAYVSTFRGHDNGFWSTSFKLKDSVANNSVFPELEATGQLMMRFGANLIGNHAKMSFKNTMIRGEGKKDSGWFKLQSGDTLNNKFKMQGVFDAKVKKPYVFFADITKPTVKSAKMNGTVLYLDMGEKLRSIENGKITLTLYATNVESGVQNMELTATSGGINGNEIFFYVHAPKNVKEYQITKIKSIEYDKKEYTGQMYGIAYADKYLARNEEPRFKVIDNAPGLIPEYFTATSPITDYAGNSLDIHTKDLTSYSLLVDKKAPEIDSVEIAGNMIAADSTSYSQPSDWPEDIDKSSVFAGVGDTLTFSAMTTEKIKTSEKSSMTAELNISQNGSKAVLETEKFEDMYDGVNKRTATKITFKPITITADMTCDNSEPIRIEKINTANVVDLYNNELATQKISKNPKQQIYFDNIAPTVNVGEITGDVNSGEFCIPLNFSDGKGTVSDFDGLTASFAWCYDQDKQIPFKYAVTTSADTPSEYKESVLNNENNLAWNKFDLPVKDYYLHIKTDNSEIKNTKLYFRTEDWAGNVGEQSVDTDINIDRVAPNVALMSMNTEYENDTAKILAKVRVTDFNTDGLNVKYQLVDKGVEPTDSDWSEGLLNDGVFDFETKFDAAQKYEKELLVYATDFKGNKSNVSRYEVYADLTKAKAKYTVVSDLSQIHTKPDVQISAPDNPDNKANATTRVTLTMGDKTYASVYDSADSKNIFDFDGTWYAVTYNEDKTGFDGVTALTADGVNKLKNFYGTVNVKFESAFADLTPVSGASIKPSNSEEEVTYQAEGDFNVMTAPVLDNVYNLEFTSIKDSNGDVIKATGVGDDKHIRRNGDMTDVRINFELSNTKIADWVTDNLDFDKSYVTITNSENNEVYNAKLSRNASQTLAMPLRDKNGNLLGTDTYRIAVYLYQIGSDSPAEFKCDTAVLLDNIKTSADVGVNRYEIIPEHEYYPIPNPIPSIVKESDTAFKTINIGNAEFKEIDRNEDEGYSLEQNMAHIVKMTLKSNDVSKELCGETIGKAEGFRLWNKACNGGEDLPFEKTTDLTREYEINLMQNPAKETLDGVTATGGLQFEKGSNTFCYQVKLENGNVSPIYEFTVNMVESIPQIAMDFDMNESQNYTDDNGTMHVISADATVKNAFSENGNVTVYYVHREDYSSWTADEIGLDEVVTLKGDSAFNYQNCRQDENGRDRLNFAFIAIDESGNSVSYIPQFKEKTKYTFENDALTVTQANLNTYNQGDYIYNFYAKNLDMDKSSFTVVKDGETYNMPMKNYQYPNELGFEGGYYREDSTSTNLSIDFTRPWSVEKAGEPFFDSITFNFVGVHGDTATRTYTKDDENYGSLATNFKYEEPRFVEVYDDDSLADYSYICNDRGVKVYFNGYLKLKGDTVYASAHYLPIYSNGTYEVEGEDMFGNTWTIPVTVTLLANGPKVTMSTLYKTKGDITANIEYTSPVTVTENDGNTFAKIENNGTNNVTVTATQPTKVTMKWTDNGAEKSKILNITNNEIKPIKPKVVWDYDEDDVVDGCIYGEVTAKLVDENGSTLVDTATGETPSHTFYPNSETEFTFRNYKNQNDTLGEDYTVTLDVTLKDYQPPEEYVDTMPPSVEMVGYTVRGGVAQSKKLVLNLYDDNKHYLNPSLPDLSGGGYETVTDSISFMKKMGWSSHYRFNVIVSDINGVKLIAKAGLNAETPTFDSTSDTIDGVSVNGRTVDITKNAEFTLFAVDSCNNVTEIPLVADNLGEAPQPHLQKVVSGDMQTVKVYLIPPEDSDFTNLIMTNDNAKQETSDGEYNGLYYIEVTGNENIVINYTYTYKGENESGELKAAVTEIDNSPANKISEVWSENAKSSKTNKSVTAQLRFDKLITKAEWKNQSGYLPEIYKLDNQVTISYSENAPTMTLVCTAVNGQVCEITLNEVKNIDKNAPIITETIQPSKNHRKVTVTLKADKEVIFRENGKQGTEFTRVINANGEYVYHFADAAGNLTEKVVKVDSIIDKDLSLTFSLASDGTDSKESPDKLGRLKVGDTVYVSANRNCTVTWNGDTTGQNLTAGAWTKLTVSEDLAGLYPTIKAKDEYSNTKYYHFMQIAMPDKKAPTIKLKKETVEIDLNSEDILSQLKANMTVSDNETEKDKIKLDVTYTKPQTTGTVRVTYTATDEAGNSSERYGYIYFYEDTQLRVSVNGEYIYRDMIVLSKNEAQNIVVESNGEPYSVKYKNGIKTVGQMKIGATELAKNKDNTEPITFVPKKAGYYTFNVQTQGRDNYRFVIYVQ